MAAASKPRIKVMRVWPDEAEPCAGKAFGLPHDTCTFGLKRVAARVNPLL